MLLDNIAILSLKQMYRSVALDLDGTLITTGLKQTWLMSAICLSFGTDFDRVQFWDLKRNGYTNFDALIEMGVSREKSKWISSAWKLQIESTYWQGLDALVLGSIELLEYLKMHGASVYLITARSSTTLLSQQLLRFRLASYFDEVCVVNPANVVDEKARALKLTGAELFVGDSELDAHAARVAQVSFVGVESGQRSKEFLSQNGVTSISSSAASVFGIST